jgi:NADH/F420H2 dehydrogenase subunit C
VSDVDPTLVDRVVARFGGRVAAHPSLGGQAAVVVATADLTEVAALLRDDPEFAFDLLIDLVGVDRLGHPGRPEPRFELLYHLRSLSTGQRLRLHVPVPDDAAEVASLWRLWHAANWLEREAWDLFGIRFTGHPNLRRILCHHRFEGHALRKDYPIQRRQRLDEPDEFLLTDDPEAA